MSQYTSTINEAGRITLVSKYNGRKIAMPVRDSQTGRSYGTPETEDLRYVYETVKVSERNITSMGPETFTFTALDLSGEESKFDTIGQILKASPNSKWDLEYSATPDSNVKSLAMRNCSIELGERAQGSKTYDIVASGNTSEFVQ